MKRFASTGVHRWALGPAVVEFYEIRRCHWCAHHRRLQPSSCGCSMLLFARAAILSERDLPPCCRCTPTAVRHSQLPTVTPGPLGGHTLFRLDGGRGRAACIALLVLHASAPLRLHSLVLYSRKLADTESRSYLARNTEKRSSTSLRFVNDPDRAP